MSDYGIKISLPGVNVQQASPEESSVHTIRDILKVSSTSEPSHFGSFKHTGTVTAAAITYTVKVVQHNLGYVPMVLAHIYHYEKDRFAFLPYDATFGDFPDVGWNIRTDAKNMTITFYTSNGNTKSGTQTADIRYYIFANPVGDS